MAREIAGLLGLTFTSYPLPDLPSTKPNIKVEVQNDKCLRYIAVEMKDVKVAPSPDWLKEAIEAVGIRSINNIVDATNLILLDDGQPVHAYDADKIDGGIVVRLAHEDEQITTLSDEKKDLNQTDLVIADYLGPLAVAGIKGGKSAEITNETKNIVIEVANFDPTTIRKTSKRLSLQTDASKRFENGISEEIAYDAARHVVGIIQKVADGEVAGVYDYYPKPQEHRVIEFSLEDITRLLGPSISEKDIEDMLNSYKYEFKKDGSKYILTIPPTRLDVTGHHDIAEEIGRYIGYNRIPTAQLPKFGEPNSKEYQEIFATKLWLAQNGFREVMNYTFTKKGDVYIAYGAKDKSALRSNLSDGLKESYEKNKLNASLLGLDSIRIFEIGTIFLKDKEEIRVATCDKGVFEELSIQDFIEKYKIDSSKNFNLQLSFSKSFKPWSIYPYITRDIAVWCSGTDSQQKLEQMITEFAKNYCVREPVLFDRFEKDGRTSVAYRLVFQSYEKTLTEEEVENWFFELTTKIKADKDFEIR
ncbi:phenylalanine--tRNA ligase subunit beta [Candidatus Nomurabacteria bacterium]|nr:phenylalanine--tRNA ligase subunit beta [Candidatus Nomurabacteria bacterium]